MKCFLSEEGLRRSSLFVYLTDALSPFESSKLSMIIYNFCLFLRSLLFFKLHNFVATNIPCIGEAFNTKDTVYLPTGFRRLSKPQPDSGNYDCNI